MATRLTLAAAIAALGIGLAGAAGAAPAGYNPQTAPGTASGTAAPHFDGSDEGGPVVHRAAPRPGEGTRDAASARLIGGGEGGPEKLHEGEGSGNAGWPGRAGFIGTSGDGPEIRRAGARG
ncbi:hypothetical protein [Roseicella aquatilis]|uniref:Uncharacterized protein n=1 Tax=Roseicella aquatilis TaxID=2527868 RepID=A0A4R4DKL3_9PROT|nr:hypothetical protein [Roseicella aquatilis]TCZ61169.1 hypothetical protein EXY23_13660 [Roseicella aquatilis]